MDHRGERRPVQTLGELRRLGTLAFIGANLLFPLGVWLTQPTTPWRAFEGEESPINWFSSVQCALLGAVGLAVWLAARAGAPGRGAWRWLVVALGFLFLSFDEQFQFHERLRDEWLVPRGVLTDVPGFKAGDVVLLLYVVAGGALGLYLLADLRRHPRGALLFLAALGLIGLLAAQDSLALPVLERGAGRHVQILVEEIGEVWAQALFGLALIDVLVHKLRAIKDAASA
jgi:hypothetical protein